MKKTFLVLSVGLLFLLAVNLAFASPNELHVKAFVDGKSVLCIKGDNIWWVNYWNDPPGKWQGKNEPTYINDVAWQPKWHGEKKEDSYSEKFVVKGIKKFAPADKVTIELVDSRGTVKLLDPKAAASTADADFCVLMDDNMNGGAWYHIIVKH